MKIGSIRSTTTSMPKKKVKKAKAYSLYILRCADDTLYTGITTDVARRVEEHNSSPVGARYTKARRPVKLAYSSEWPNRALASREEARIKKLPRKKKLILLSKAGSNLIQ